MAEKVIKLPSGNSVTLRDAKDLKVKDRNKIFADTNNLEGVLLNVGLSNSIISCLVKEWTFDLLPPSVRAESLGELSIADYDALLVETAEAQEILFPSFEPTLENEADPKVDTANSNA